MPTPSTTIRENAYQKFFRLLAQANQELCPDKDYRLQVTFESDGTGILLLVRNEDESRTELFDFMDSESLMKYLAASPRERILMSRI